MSVINAGSVIIRTNEKYEEVLHPRLGWAWMDITATDNTHYCVNFHLSGLRRKIDILKMGKTVIFSCEYSGHLAICPEINAIIVENYRGCGKNYEISMDIEAFDSVVESLRLLALKMEELYPSN